MGKDASSTTSLIQVSSEGTCRVITLNRPRALHTLNLEMVQAMLRALRTWETGSAEVIIIRSAPIDGKHVFCAGGDVVGNSAPVMIVALVKSLGNQHDKPVTKESLEFLYTEYVLNHYIAAYPKPIVAIIDGITSKATPLFIVVGGGAGISVHAPFRIATENTVFAMPEAAIGYFPDVGASFFLPRIDHPLGIYLGLTGRRLKGQDV